MNKIILFIGILFVFILLDIIYYLYQNLKKDGNIFEKATEGIILALMTLAENFMNNGEAKKALVCNLTLFIYRFIAIYFKIQIPTYDEISIILEKVYNLYKDGIKNKTILSEAIPQENNKE